MNFSKKEQIIGSEIIHFKSIDSTNDYALNLIAKNNPTEGTVISADFQTNGKGQRNNNWQSDHAQNLLMSVILYPRFLVAKNNFYLSMLSANAVLSFLKTYLDTKKLSIKWPNDIYFENNKIAGILIQNNFRSTAIESSIIGVGLNVNQTDFSVDIPNPISLKMISGQSFNILNLREKLLEELDKSYHQLLQGQLKKIKSSYENNLYNLGTLSQISAGGQSYSASILGVESDGRLIVNQDGKIIKLIH